MFEAGKKFTLFYSHLLCHFSLAFFHLKKHDLSFRIEFFSSSACFFKKIHQRETLKHHWRVNSAVFFIMQLSFLIHQQCKMLLVASAIERFSVINEMRKQEIKEVRARDCSLMISHVNFTSRFILRKFTIFFHFT